MMTKVLLTQYTNYFGRAHYSTVYMENVSTLVKSDHYGFFFFLPCGCGRQFDWCAGWQEVPWSAAAHLQVLAWTGVEWPTPKLQPYSSPMQILRHAVNIAP